MPPKTSLEEKLGIIRESEAFSDWQGNLTNSFHNKEKRSELISEVREYVAINAAELTPGDMKKLQDSVIAHLVGLASQSAKRPQEEDETPLHPRSPQEIEDLVIDRFPYPIATSYRHITETGSNAGAFGCLLDTFEGLLHYMVTVILSTYWHQGASDLVHNRRLLERFYKGKWGTGILMELLRETAKLYLSSPDALPYPQLVGYLFTKKGKPSPSLRVLEAFVELRNSAWGHWTGRDDQFYAKILPEHLQRLNAELNRCDWLARKSLWLPKVINDNGWLTIADLLNGDRIKRDREVSLELDPKDLDVNGGDIVPGGTLLLVDEETGEYLTLFPLSLFLFQQTRPGVFFLNDLNWAAKSQLLRKARYLTYDPSLGDHEARSGEPSISNLESKIRLISEQIHQFDAEELSTLDREPIVGLRYADVSGVFKGREDKLLELRQLLGDPGVKFICITGRGGIGKTALLSMVCAEMEGSILNLSNTETSNSSGGIIYVTGKPTLERLYHDFGRVLGSPHDHELLDCWRDISQSVPDKVRFLLSKLRSGSYLVALDSFEDSLDSGNTILDGDLRTFVDLCLTTPNAVRLIATSRRRVVMDGHVSRALRIVLLDNGLSDAEGISLLRDLDPDGDLRLLDSSDTLLSEVTQRCYGIPYALEKIAGILSSQDGWTIEQLLRNNDLFNSQVVENLGVQHYHSLTDDQRRVVEALSVYSKPVSSDAIGYLLKPFFPDVDVNACLRILALNYFVTYQRGHNNYGSFHPFDRDYAYLCIPDEGVGYTKTAAHRRAAKFCLERAEMLRAGKPIRERMDWDTHTQVEWTDQMEQAFEHLFSAKAWQELMEASDTIKVFYLAKLDWAYIQECADMCHRMLYAAREAANETREAEWLHDWAVMSHHLGDHDMAEKSCMQALKIARRVKKERLQAMVLDRLAKVMMRQCNYKKARECYEQSAELKRKTGNPEIILLTIWNSSASLLEGEGNLDKALELQMKVLEAARRSKSHLSILSSQLNIARILGKQGSYGEAQRISVEAMKLARQYDNRNYLAIILFEAGRVALTEGKFDKAQGFFCKSREIMAYPDDKAQLLHAFAMLNHYRGNLVDARQYYQDALVLNLPFITYSCSVRLGILSLEEENSEEAEAYLDRCIKLCSELLGKTPNLYDALYHFALAQLSIGQTKSALSTYQDALAACSAKGVVQVALRDLQMLERIPGHVCGLGEAIQLLRGVFGQIL